MKKLLLVALVALMIFGCKKNNTPGIVPITPDQKPKTYSNKIVLNDVKVAADSLKLSWSMLDTAKFTQYSLFRRDYPGGQMLPIKQLYKKDETSVADVSVPYSPLVQYQVVGSLSSGTLISSNIVSYSRPNITVLNINPFDVIYSNTDQLLYFFEKNGNISIYDLQKNAITKTISTAATIGYCDFGSYNGKKELYVPRTDGWIFVYDAATLEKITQISIGLSTSCVVFDNNNLFVSTAAWTQRPLKVYNRATGQKIAENGDFELTRFKKVPNSNTDLLEITITIGPTDQDYYKFMPNGTFVSHMNDTYHGDYPLDASIFEFFPDGGKYITSSSGAIYNKSMIYETSLPRGNLSFTTFALNQVNQLIYAGCQNKNVEVYSMNNYTHVKTITTNAYPFKIFDNNDKILCISKTTMFNSYSSTDNNKIVIENLNK
ncbi:MAG: hypothetical protein JWR67_3938 [Mucilaginibacter sp.]|nr:hypothetical protein [Mucilaginibacter sp.]